jgi:sugar phosphate isomerase/epimerase
MSNLITRELSYYLEIISRRDSDYYFDEAICHDKLSALETAGVMNFGVDGIPVNINHVVLNRALDFVADWLTTKNMHITSFHYAGSTYDVANASQNMIKELMCKNIDCFSRWKPANIVVHAGWFGQSGKLPVFNERYQQQCKQHGYDKVLETLAENLRYFASLAGEHQINLALENIFGDFPFSDQESLPVLIKQIDMPNVGYCIDSGHAHLSGQSVSGWLRFAGKKLFETHFHDNNGCGLDQHMPVGFGTIDWLDVVRTLDEISYAGPVTFEIGGWPADNKAKGYTQAIDWWRTCEEMARTGFWKT